MAKALNTLEAKIFEDGTIEQKVAALEDTAESLLNRHEQALEMTPELSFWFIPHIHGPHGY
jgi:hypothetical protein